MVQKQADESDLRPVEEYQQHRKKQPEKRKSGNVDWKATRKKIQQDGMLRDSNQKQSQLNKKKNRAQSTINGFDQAK